MKKVLRNPSNHFSTNITNEKVLRGHISKNVTVVTSCCGKAVSFQQLSQFLANKIKYTLILEVWSHDIKFGEDTNFQIDLNKI